MRNDDKIVEQLHSDFKWDEPIGDNGVLNFVPAMDNIRVTMIDAPSVGRFRKLISTFLCNTWNDHVDFGPFDDERIDRTIDQVFRRELLPTALETIKLTFAIEGIDCVTTTHLIRHRLNGYSAATMADRDCRRDYVCVPESIGESPEFIDRFKKLHEDAYQLYADMIDSKEVHGMDARLVLPRATSSNFYIVTSCINQIIDFVNARRDEEILYCQNNIMAYRVWQAVLKVYPFLKHCVDFEAPDHFAVRQINKGKTIMFAPGEKNERHTEWSPRQFIYGDKRREDFRGGQRYLELKAQIMADIDAVDPSHEPFHGMWG